MRPGQPTALIANPGADLYGSDRMALETVAALHRAGWKVVVTLPHEGPLVTLLRERGAEVVFGRAPVVRKGLLSVTGLITLAGQFLRAVPSTVTLLRSLRPDVLYVSTITAPLWLLLGRILRIPTVCHIHEGEGSASPLVLKLLNAPLLLADRRLINSRYSLEVLAQAYPKLAQRTQVVYNAVRGPEEMTSTREELSAPIRLLYVGRLSPRKGPDVAIEALALLRDRGTKAQLDLVGAVFPGYEWFREKLDALVAERGLAESVRFVGFRTTAWSYAAEADIILVPSAVDEPFGNTAVEAALAARPSVVSDIAGLREATAGMLSVKRVDAGDAVAIADAVQEITSQWPQLRTDAQRDSALASDRYSFESYSTAIISVFEELRTRR